MTARNRAISHTLSVESLLTVAPDLDLEPSEDYEELPEGQRQTIGHYLGSVTGHPERLQRGDIVFFDGPARKYGRFFVERINQQWRLIRENSDEMNPYGDHMGAIPSSFLVPSEFPPRYWGDTYMEPVPFDGQIFSRPLTINDFYLATAVRRRRDGDEESFPVVILPIIARNIVYYVTDLQDATDDLVRQQNANRLIDELQTHPVDRIGWLTVDDSIAVVGDNGVIIDPDVIITTRDL